MTILYMLDIRLKVALLVESVRGQGHQEFTKELCMVLMPPPVAFMLGFSRLLSPCLGLSVCFRVGFSQLALPPYWPPRPLSLYSPSPSSIYTWPQSLSIFRTLSGGQKFTSLGSKRTKREEVEKRPGLTSATATYSSVTFNDSAEPEGARAQDLVKPSTEAYLAKRSAAKKAIACAWVFTEGSPTTRQATRWLSVCSRRSQCLVEGRALPGLSAWGRPLNPYSFRRRGLNP
ncbi:LOW QUALITY PROTEIN: hypothetical protein Cgig2_034047 [Carnegiea gigantea]|uniref:Uncharacterized protein n=1 Tax=Carnegiea gigantea TaxID=171969 RepID=A0A9Q1KLF4_9CARY|nr:LOW QUALITY PROTEIN: hypothetical protein Cgig2_034047 [Carnegiea gigantea]